MLGLAPSDTSVVHNVLSDDLLKILARDADKVNKAAKHEL